MKTANLIQASAEIVRVISLKKGDVYKRLVESDYSEDKLTYGIVLDVLYNGEEAAIQSIEFEPSYKDLETTLKVFSGGKDIKLFSATDAELKIHLNDCVAVVEREVESKSKELASCKEKLKKVKEVVSGELVKKLTAPTTSNEPLLPDGVAAGAPAKKDNRIDLDEVPF